MLSLRSSISSILAMAAAIATVIAAPIAAQPPQFSEQLTVRERPILVSLPSNLANARLQSADFQVLVDDQPREVTRGPSRSPPPAERRGRSWSTSTRCWRARPPSSPRRWRWPAMPASSPGWGTSRW